MAVVRVVTANTQHKPVVVRQVVEREGAPIDVACFQEVEWADGILSVRALQADGWGVWFGTNPGGGSQANPICWRPGIRLVAKGSVKAHDRPKERGWGPARWINWAALEHDGAVFAVVNTHMIHQAWSSVPARRPLWQRHANALADLIADLRKTYGNVIGAADVNRSRWAPAGTVGHWASRGTLGPGIYYDLLFTAGQVDTSTVGRIATSSDHDALAAAFVLPAPATHPKKEQPVSKIVPYASWSRRSRGATRRSHPIGSTLGITAHWEGPTMGRFEHSQCAGKVRGIQAFHRDKRGWADIAYNAIVCPHGYVFEGRGPGVKSAANGNALDNDDWYAVCYLGGERDGFTDAGKEGFLTAFGWLAREGGAGPRRNGHRDHKATACPGDEIYRWVHSLASGAGTPSRKPTEKKDWFDMAEKDDLKDVIRETLQVRTPDGKLRQLPTAMRGIMLRQQAMGHVLDKILVATKDIPDEVKAGLRKELDDALQDALIDVDVTVRQK